MCVAICRCMRSHLGSRLAETHKSKTRTFIAELSTVAKYDVINNSCIGTKNHEILDSYFIAYYMSWILIISK